VGGGFLTLAAALSGLACDDEIAPEPPKSGNLPPETWLVVESDSLGPQFYQVPLRWLGSDADGRVAAYQVRIVCEDLGGSPCPAPGPPTTTTALSDTFAPPVPNGRARYTFEVAAVDDEGLADPDPARQSFELRNGTPTAFFPPGSLPTSTLPAITFYLDGADPDSTPNPDDRDSKRDLATFRAWLDGGEGAAKVVPVEAGGVTFAPEDFAGQYGPRTVTAEVVDQGDAVSAAIQHTWTVVAPPDSGILLVDDCRMGGAFAQRSDQSYRNVLTAGAPTRYVVLDIARIPRLSEADLAATLSLFDRVVWYTDADIVSSGALALSRGALEALLDRRGRLYLCSGLAFGTGGDFGDREERFRELFGISRIFLGPDSTTNFAVVPPETVLAAVHPGLDRFAHVTGGLGAVMECFASSLDGATRSLYFYPESTFVRATDDSTRPFVNPVQFDVGVQHDLPGGGKTAFVSFPLGFPMNDGTLTLNEVEIEEVLKLLGILGP
jgi:hypothetical protein